MFFNPGQPVYVPLGGGQSFSSTETVAQMPSPVLGAMSNLYAKVSIAPGVTNAYFITLRDNAQSQSLGCVIQGTATSCSDLTHTFNPAQGDLLDWQIIPAGNIAVVPSFQIAASYGSQAVTTFTNIGGQLPSGLPGLSLGVQPLNIVNSQLAIGSGTVFYTVPGTGLNPYRLFVYVMLTQAASSSETIGPLTVTFNDGTGAKSINIGIGAVSSFTGVGSSTAITGNTPGNANSVFAGILPFSANGGTQVTIALPYTSAGATPALYSIQLRLDTF